MQTDEPLDGAPAQMSRKIFISYRRDDSAASAIGIGQYLEHEFGGKNVFIDVDMRAGAKFPQVLEARLAECKVMLVLIGPGWLDARDEQGHRRLNNPDDWVRLEIAHALRRNITVIPVRINGAALPARAALPEDIRGVLDHQATSVTHASFRHDMAGLVRDIRSIPSPRTWRRPAAIAAGVMSLIGIGFVLVQNFGTGVLERIRAPSAAQNTEGTSQNGIWTSQPGEWVMYATDSQTPAVAYYFAPSSVRKFDDAVAYKVRFPVTRDPQTVKGEMLPQPTYEDQLTVIECKKSTFVIAERTLYSNSGAVISRFNFGDPQTLISNGSSFTPNSILSMAKRLLCENLSAPALSKDSFANLNLKLIDRAANRSIYYGPPEPISGSANEFELVTLLKYDVEQPFTTLNPNSKIVGAPSPFRSLGQRFAVNCNNRKLQSSKMDYFDSQGHWLFVLIPTPQPEPFDPPLGSTFDALMKVTCGPAALIVSGTYNGTNYTTYKHGPQGEQQIALIVYQNGDDVTVTFRTALGDYGKGTGKLKGTRIDSMPLQSAAAMECAGSYDASVEFSGDTAKWSFKGNDCNGPMEGHGTATRTKS